MKEMLKEDRPYEKCEQNGAKFLTDSELLSVLLRTGTKGITSLELARMLLHPGGPKEGLLAVHTWSYEALLKIPGIGRVKALQILCLSELAKRLAKAEAEESLCFDNPSSIAAYYMEEFRHQEQELLMLLLLNTKSKLIGERIISKGTVNSAIISPRELMIEALRYQAVSMILVHNHPSGDASPSHADIMVTQQIAKAGALIGIELLDHIILGDRCYVSMAEQKLLGQKYYECN